MSVQVLDRPAATGLRRQAWSVVVLLLVVCYCDQMSKAWAWRHADRAHINSGANMLVSPAVGGWLRNPGLGAVFDVAGAVVLGTALVLLVRRRRDPAVLTALTLLIAGWVSNLADRLGLRYVVAPGSRRGVVDFLHFWGRLWNVADLAILAGSALLLPALAHAAVRRRAKAAGPVSPPSRNPLGSPVGRRIVLAGVAVTAVLAAVGAVTCAGSDGRGLYVVEP
jgi:lipoprotein signal peptidase